MCSQNVVVSSLQSISLEFPYISAHELSAVLSKIAVKVGKNGHLLQEEKKFQSNVVNLLENICRACVLATKIKTAHFQRTISCVLEMLQSPNLSSYLLEINGVQELLRVAYSLLANGTIKKSPNTLEFLFDACPVLIEREVIDLLTAVSNSSSKNSTSAFLVLQGHKLVSVSCVRSSVFQRTLLVMMHAWYASNGHPAIQHLMSEFLSSVILQCDSDSFIFLFPEHIQPLVFLLSISPQEFQLQKPSDYLWNSVLRACALQLCCRQEIAMLMGLFPSWYEKLILDVNHKENIVARELLKLLWLCDDEDSLECMLQEYQFISSGS